MSINHNKEVVRTFLKGVEERDRPTLERLLRDDGDYWIIGTMPLSGKKSKDEFLSNIGDLWKMVDGPVAMEIHDLTAEEDRVSMMGTGRMKLVDGRPYENTYHVMARVVDGRITGWREYFDTLMVWDLMAKA